MDILSQNTFYIIIQYIYNNTTFDLGFEEKIFFLYTFADVFPNHEFSDVSTIN